MFFWYWLTRVDMDKGLLNGLLVVVVTMLLNSTQLNSTQRASMEAGVKHLNVRIYLVTIA